MVREAAAVALGRRPVTDLRRASTVCLVRDGDGIEVLMVRRPHTARFMPGVWVFPGGAVDEEDSNPPNSFVPFGEGSEWRVAAARELIEETGVWLTTGGAQAHPLVQDVFAAVSASALQIDLDSLIYFSNWITPAVFPIRFDTRFYLALDMHGVDAQFNSDELIDLVWVSPSVALRRDATQDWDVAFPTRRTLELLSTESTVVALAERFAGLDIVPPVEPRLLVGHDEARILMPDDPEFDAAGPAQADPTILERLAEVVASGARVPAEFKRRP
ncbi:MAG: NUDIX hydrolase [Acidimicrobiia bacterium]|nr:MAG: NUDIX hydrolase [Acidimicrobiia bacterium]